MYLRINYFYCQEKQNSLKICRLRRWFGTKWSDTVHPFNKAHIERSPSVPSDTLIEDRVNSPVLSVRSRTQGAGDDGAQSLMMTVLSGEDWRSACLAATVRCTAIQQEGRRNSICTLSRQKEEGREGLLALKKSTARMNNPIQIRLVLPFILFPPPTDISGKQSSSSSLSVDSFLLDNRAGGSLTGRWE